jgi:hypothetical protein
MPRVPSWRGIVAARVTFAASLERRFSISAAACTLQF